MSIGIVGAEDDGAGASRSAPEPGDQRSMTTTDSPDILASIIARMMVPNHYRVPSIP